MLLIIVISYLNMNFCTRYLIALYSVNLNVMLFLSLSPSAAIAHFLINNMIVFTSEKGCIALCVDNMKRGSIKSATHDDSDVLSFSEIVNIFVTVFYFLKGFY